MIRSKLTFANVVSVVALFVALGGAGYAVQTGSVGKRELADKSVGFGELTPRVFSEVAKGALPTVIQDEGPSGTGTDPCQFAGNALCRNIPGEEHDPPPWGGAGPYTITCPADLQVALGTDDFGNEYVIYTLVTNAEHWTSLGAPAGSQTSSGGYTAMQYGFDYYAFDRDHVQGYAACVPTSSPRRP